MFKPKESNLKLKVSSDVIFPSLLYYMMQNKSANNGCKY